MQNSLQFHVVSPHAASTEAFMQHCDNPAKKLSHLGVTSMSLKGFILVLCSCFFMGVHPQESAQQQNSFLHLQSHFRNSEGEIQVKQIWEVYLSCPFLIIINNNNTQGSHNCLTHMGWGCIIHISSKQCPLTLEPTNVGLVPNSSYSAPSSLTCSYKDELPSRRDFATLIIHDVMYDLRPVVKSKS